MSAQRSHSERQLLKSGDSKLVINESCKYLFTLIFKEGASNYPQHADALTHRMIITFFFFFFYSFGGHGGKFNGCVVLNFLIFFFFFFTAVAVRQLLEKNEPHRHL